MSEAGRQHAEYIVKADRIAERMERIARKAEAWERGDVEAAVRG
jgi:hypothetical protein